MAKKSKGLERFINISVGITITIILLLLIELISTGIIAINRASAKPKEKDYGLADNAYINAYIHEENRLQYEYAPYLGYRASDFSGEYITIKDHIRQTSNPCEENAKTTIWFFGGSTTFGMGTPDNYTIPSLVSTYLCQEGMPARVVNFGELGYVSTQEVIRLMEELREEKPDIIVFYDGYNDIYAAYQNGYAGAPHNEYKRRAEFNTYGKGSIKEAIMATNTFHVLQFALSRVIKRQMPDSDVTADEIATVYADNIKTARILAEENGIDFLTFFQPACLTKKTLSEKEKTFCDEKSIFGKEVDISSIEEEAEQELKGIQFYNLAHIFDDTDETIYFDPIHTGAKGNAIIAKNIAETLAPSLLDSSST